MPRGGALLVFGKIPRPGLVKTRMTPPLAPEQAAALYACMLDDVLEQSASAAARLDLLPVLAVHPWEGAESLAARAPAGFRVVAQQGSDLGARMDHAVAEAAAAGHAPILLRGSDSPALPISMMAAALDALAEASVVVCPDLDGGYNLVGVRAPITGLFRHTMSVHTSLDELCLNAEQRCQPVRRLPPHFDLDTVADLAQLAKARAATDTLPCPRTLRFCDENDLWRHARPAP